MIVVHLQQEKLHSNINVQISITINLNLYLSNNHFGWWREYKDKDLFIGPQEFVVGYSKAPEQLQSSARPICHSHAMTRTGREPATLRIAA